MQYLPVRNGYAIYVQHFQIRNLSIYLFCFFLKCLLLLFIYLMYAAGTIICVAWVCTRFPLLFLETDNKPENGIFALCKISCDLNNNNSFKK